MKKTIWTFGLIAGAIMSGFMLATVPFIDSMGAHSVIVGYAGMVAAFLLVYFGIRSYRDNVLGGTIGFGRAFLVGLLITAIASACYTATWEVLFFTRMPDFAEHYGQHAIQQAQADGRSEAEIAALRARMAEFAKNYRNPVYNSALTFMEPLPVGILITLVSAGLLRRRRRDGEPARAVA